MGAGQIIFLLCHTDNIDSSCLYRWTLNVRCVWIRLSLYQRSSSNQSSFEQFRYFIFTL